MTDAALAPAPPSPAARCGPMPGCGSRPTRPPSSSAVYLVLMTLACIVGPWFTAHAFTTIYQDYVRVPPSLSPYPKAEMIEARARRGGKRRARVDLADWQQDGMAASSSTSPRPSRSMSASPAISTAPTRSRMPGSRDVGRTACRLTMIGDDRAALFPSSAPTIPAATC